MTNILTIVLLIIIGCIGGYGGASVAGFITVFINGIATEVQAGPLDMKTVFGDDVMLVHSSGVPVPSNEYGFLMQSLEHGESYFLVGIYSIHCQIY